MKFNSVTALVTSNKFWYVMFLILFSKLYATEILISSYHLETVGEGCVIVFLFFGLIGGLIAAFCCLGQTSKWLGMFS